MTFKRILLILLATAIITQAVIYIGDRMYRAGFDAGEQYLAKELLALIYGDMHPQEYRFIELNKVTK